jgi:hypothetical protein
VARHHPRGIAAVPASQAGSTAGEGGEVGRRRDLVLETDHHGDLGHDDGDDAQHHRDPHRVDRDRTTLGTRHGSSSAETADACSVRPPT